MVPAARLAVAPEVSVVIPCHGAARTIPALLDALAAQTHPSFEVIVADTGADGTRRRLDGMALRHGGHVRVVDAPLRGGPGAKRNAGAAAARGGLLAFTDADCVPEADWLAAGAAAGAEIVQGPTLPDRDDGSFLAHHVVVRGPTPLFETSNLFVDRRMFEDLGGFTTRYYTRFGVPFGEDAEFGWRAVRAGGRRGFAERAVVRHPLGQPSLRAHLREQWLARAFPLLVRDVPELRTELLWQRPFLSRRTAAFAAAAAGAAAARRFPPAALAAVPYARMLRATAPDTRTAAARIASDATLAAALAAGSVIAREPVL